MRKYHTNPPRVEHAYNRKLIVGVTVIIFLKGNRKGQIKSKIFSPLIFFLKNKYLMH